MEWIQASCGRGGWSGYRLAVGGEGGLGVVASYSDRASTHHRGVMTHKQYTVLNTVWACSTHKVVHLCEHTKRTYSTLYT